MSRKIRVLIVDDEPLARQNIRLLLQDDAEVAVAGECSGVDAAALIARERPDIMFLDVQMPEVDGFELLDQVGLDAVPVIVFVTAYDAYALKAFDVNALDYLLKPFDDARFHRTLARAKERLRAGEKGSDAAAVVQLLRRPAAFRQRFLVRGRESSVIVLASDIDWIEAADYYVELHAGGKAHLLREPLAELEKQLDPERFFRAHRSAIVNLDRVREVHPLFRGDCLLVLADGTRVRLSRTRRSDFERIFAAPAGD